MRRGWRLPENTPNSTDFRSCGRTRRASETGSIYRKIAGLHPVFCGELVTGYPCITLPGNATKGAFRAGGADRNRTSVGSQGVQRAASPLCWVQGRSALLGSRGKAHWRVEGSRPIGSRVKRLAQGELMPCVNSYWVLPDAEIRRFSGFAAAPLREKSTENGGMKIETDTAQRTLRQAWHL